MAKQLSFSSKEYYISHFCINHNNTYKNGQTINYIVKSR